jgi:hypothetical protein
MKENYTQLYTNEVVAKAVGDYALAHSTKLPKHILDHHAWGVESQERANYMISPLQAEFQLWFAKAMGAKRSMSCPPLNIMIWFPLERLSAIQRNILAENGIFLVPLLHKV